MKGIKREGLTVKSVFGYAPIKMGNLLHFTSAHPKAHSLSNEMILPHRERERKTKEKSERDRDKDSMTEN
jgi:hypothetical protein